MDPFNWAGHSEFIAIGRFLNRTIKIYGQDNILNPNGVKIDQNGKVLPYLQFKGDPKKEPLRIWKGKQSVLFQKVIKILND